MAERQYDAVLFDLDDTILKSGEIKWRHHKHVAKKFYGIDLTDEVLREHWGKPFNELIGYLYQNSDTVENMIAANRESESNFPKEIQIDTKVLLGRLVAVRVVLGIVTAINSDYAINDLAINNLDVNQFLFVQGADETPYHKPDPRVFDPALNKLEAAGIARDRIVYVGDAISDFKAARGAKLDFIGVTTGFVSLDEFQTAGAIACASLTEVADIILNT